MKIHYLYMLLLGFLSFGLTSCEDNVNDWPVDESYNRLFRTTSFVVGDTEPTAIQLRFKGVIDATKYVFEFSEGDSLEFTNIVATAEIHADTLTAYSEANSPVLTEFRIWFTELKGTTSYSVRMKAVSETKNMESGYSQVYFKTPDEQIFNNATPATDKVTLVWIPGLKVTHIQYWENINGQEPVEQTYPLTEEQKAEGKATIKGLTSGTSYSALIYNDDAKRGLMTFKTLGIKDSEGSSYRVLSADAGLINTLLSDYASQGIKVIALVFDGNEPAYEIETLTIPEGIDKLFFVGETGANGTLPELYIHSVKMLASMSGIVFQNVDLNARLNSSNYVFALDNANCFRTLGFDGCIIRNIGRCLVRFNHDALDIESIAIDNCLIQNVGISGYGMFNMGKDIVNVGLISITNSTITEFGSDRLMHLKRGVVKVVVDKSTICNYTSGAGQIFRFDSEPGSVTMTNSIFAGNNNNKKINSGNSAYTYLEFYGCFLTSDFQVNTIAFTNATILGMTSEEMFADPKNGDFRLKEGVRFAGEGKAGDPRWW